MSAPLRAGDIIAGWDVHNPGLRSPRTGIVTSCAEEPEGDRWRVVIETRDKRKTSDTATRQYVVWWPVAT